MGTLRAPGHLCIRRAFIQACVLPVALGAAAAGEGGVGKQPPSSRCSGAHWACRRRHHHGHKRPLLPPSTPLLLPHPLRSPLPTSLTGSRCFSWPPACPSSCCWQKVSAPAGLADDDTGCAGAWAGACTNNEPQQKRLLCTVRPRPAPCGASGQSLGECVIAATWRPAPPAGVQKCILYSYAVKLQPLLWRFAEVVMELGPMWRDHECWFGQRHHHTLGSNCWPPM